MKDGMDLAVPLEVSIDPLLELPLLPPSNEDTLFSEHELVDAPPLFPSTAGAETSLAGTSASRLTNPSLTDMISNFPIWPQVEQPVTNTPSITSVDAIQPKALNPASALGHPPRGDYTETNVEACENGLVHRTDPDFLSSEPHHWHRILTPQTPVLS